MSLIVLEGIDFCGKSTQVKMLKEALEKRGYPVKTSEEPTKSLPIGLYIREYAKGTLKDKRAPRLSEALLFYADRIEHLTKEIVPWLTEGNIVILDRYWFSTYAYQVILMPTTSNEEKNLFPPDLFIPPLIELLNDYILPPDLALYIDVTAGVAMSRAEEAGRKLTVFEHELELVRFNYLTLCDTHKLERIDGMLDAEEVHEEILRRVLLRL